MKQDFRTRKIEHFSNYLVQKIKIGKGLKPDGRQSSVTDAGI